jgi:hypothetical protein
MNEIEKKSIIQNDKNKLAIITQKSLSSLRSTRQTHGSGYEIGKPDRKTNK